MSTESYVLLRREKHARPQLKFELEVCGLDIDVKKKSERERDGGTREPLLCQYL